MITVDDFAIDAVTKFTPSFKAKATTQPIEKGANTTDHVIDEPDTVSMECVVSDNPIGEMVAIRAREPGVPSERAFFKFKTLKESKKIITVVTDHHVYTDMVLLEFTPNFDKDTGESLRFTLMFQNLNIVQNDRQFVPVSTPIASNKDNRGNKQGKKPPDNAADGKADRNSSVLWKLTH